MKIRVILPAHLRTLARVGDEITVEVQEPVTCASILDAVEAAYPVLGGTLRDHATRVRRPFVRFFAGGEDYSNAPAATVLPDGVRLGSEPFLILGAIAGG